MKKGPHLVVYDRLNDERISSLDFGTIRTGSSTQELEVWLWNKKDFTDAPSATDVRIAVRAANPYAEEIVENEYVMVKSDGVMDPDEVGIVDDEETEFTSIGGALLDDTKYHSIGEILSNCARRLIFIIDIPGEMEVSGIPSVIVQAGCMSEDVVWLYAEE